MFIIDFILNGEKGVTNPFLQSDNREGQTPAEEFK